MFNLRGVNRLDKSNSARCWRENSFLILKKYMYFLIFFPSFERRILNSLSLTLTRDNHEKLRHMLNINSVKLLSLNSSVLRTYCSQLQENSLNISVLGFSCEFLKCV